MIHCILEFIRNIQKRQIYIEQKVNYGLLGLRAEMGDGDVLNLDCDDFCTARSLY